MTSAFILGAFLMPVVMLLMGRVLYAYAMLAAVFGAVLIFFPRYAFYSFLVSLAFWAPQRLSATFVIHPFDLCVAMIAVGMIADFLLRTRTKIRLSRFDTPLIVLIIATGLSGIFAYAPSYSLVPSIRIIIIYLAFRAVIKFGLEIGVRPVLIFYIYLVFGLSLVNVAQFVMTGGQTRIFGLAWLGYETFSMTALPMATAFLLWSNRRSERLKFGLICITIGIGILAMQSRGPLLAVALAIPVLLFVTARKAGREKSATTRRTLKVILLSVAAVAVLLVFIESSYIAGAQIRYADFIASLTDPEGTIALRIILWKTALRTFMDFPLTGIGIGNFKLAHQIYPELKLIPQFNQVRGMSAHNVILHYLAETGLVGALALVVLAWKGLVSSYRGVRYRLSGPDSQVAMALFIAMFVFCVTLLFMRAWTWGQGGYILALIFGLVAAWQIESSARQDRTDLVDN